MNSLYSKCHVGEINCFMVTNPFYSTALAETGNAN